MGAMSATRLPFDWSSSRVLVTGGAGFLGRRVVARLESVGARRVATTNSREFDLRDEAQAAELFDEQRPDVVIDLAAVVGVIGMNREQPVRLFRDNLRIGTHVVEHAQRVGVSKFVGVGTVCAYPKHTPIPFVEADLWNGYPEESNAPYGLAKKMMLVHLQACRAESGFNGIFLLPVNLYGPGDNFAPESSHVIPALIRKFCAARNAGAAQVVVWGDGTASREFLHVEDAAIGIVAAAAGYDDPEPMNLGSGREITIAELAGLIRELVGYEGRIIWDPSRPNGQPRRCVDTTRAREAIGFEAKRGLREGLLETIAWWETQDASR